VPFAPSPIGSLSYEEWFENLKVNLLLYLIEMKLIRCFGVLGACFCAAAQRAERPRASPSPGPPLTSPLPPCSLPFPSFPLQHKNQVHVEVY